MSKMILSALTGFVFVLATSLPAQSAAAPVPCYKNCKWISSMGCLCQVCTQCFISGTGKDTCLLGNDSGCLYPNPCWQTCSVTGMTCAC